MRLEIETEMWGTLKVDGDDLADKLAEATRAVYAASMAAQYRNATGYPVNSSWSDLLGGLSQAIDAVIAEVEAEREPERDKAPDTDTLRAVVRCPDWVAYDARTGEEVRPGCGHEFEFELVHAAARWTECPACGLGFDPTHPDNQPPAVGGAA